MSVSVCESGHPHDTEEAHMFRVLTIVAAVVALGVSAPPASAGTKSKKSTVSTEPSPGAGRPGSLRSDGTNMRPWSVTHNK